MYVLLDAQILHAVSAKCTEVFLTNERVTDVCVYYLMKTYSYFWT